jgi:peptidoglycan/xylan/chitin deacetylase (PgdA/CDA1 family)
VTAYASPLAATILGVPYPGVLSRVKRSSNHVALTFDDGPHPVATPAILGQLQRLDMRATFFMVGCQAKRHPALVQEVAAAGHEIGSHGFRHLPHTALPPRCVKADLTRADALLEDILGQPVVHLRAPFGAASLATVHYAHTTSRQLVAWSRWGYDWLPRQEPRRLAQRVAGAARAGDILLLHDSDRYSAGGSWRSTLAALAVVRALLDERDLQATSIAAARR